MSCPDPACTHRTEFSPVDQEQDIKLSQSILAGSRSNQTDGEVLVGVDVTSCQQPPQRQRQVKRKLCVSLHQSLTKLLKRNKCSGSLPARWGETRHTSHCPCPNSDPWPNRLRGLQPQIFYTTRTIFCPGL